MTRHCAVLALPLLLQLLQLLSAAATGPLSPAAAQLQQLLKTAVKEAQRPLLTELTQLRLRLDLVENASHQAAAPPLTLNVTCQSATRLPQPEPQPVPQPEPQPEPEPEPEPQPAPKCVTKPSPLTASALPYTKPAVPACAATCLQLRDEHVTTDGVYWLSGLPVPVYCDLSLDGGGWTLLLTAFSRDDWDALAVYSHNKNSASLDDNYSILRYADAVRDLGSGSRFAYRIEAQADTGRQHWGGIWLAPRSYSFLHETDSQTDVRLVRKFDTWSYKDRGIKKRMPWWNTGASNSPAALTTTGSSGNWWGTLVTDRHTTNYNHSPWIEPEAPQTGKVLYWMREEIN